MSNGNLMFESILPLSSAFTSIFISLDSATVTRIVTSSYDSPPLLGNTEMTPTTSVARASEGNSMALQHQHFYHCSAYFQHSQMTDLRLLSIQLEAQMMRLSMYPDHSHHLSRSQWLSLMNLLTLLN